MAQDSFLKIKMLLIDLSFTFDDTAVIII